MHRPPVVLLAYSAAEVLALIPATPGGLGFVEGGLVAMFKLAGVPVGDALAATLLYRIAAFWLPILVGEQPSRTAAARAQTLAAAWQQRAQTSNR